MLGQSFGSNHATRGPVKRERLVYEDGNCHSVLAIEGDTGHRVDDRSTAYGMLFVTERLAIVQTTDRVNLC